MDEPRRDPTQDTEEPEVEGHIHPMPGDLARDLHASRQRDLVGEAERGRQARPAADRDGGILSRLRRVVGRES